MEWLRVSCFARSACNDQVLFKMCILVFTIIANPSGFVAIVVSYPLVIRPHFCSKNRHLWRVDTSQSREKNCPKND